MEQVTLSIITVNYNNNIGLIQTLESLKNQTFSSYEHIIIDAASTDGSKETITKYEKETSHLTYWSSEPDRGIYDGMNKGLKHANGEYLYFLNSGDCLIENILQKIPFDGTEYIYGDIEMVGKRKRKIGKSPDKADIMFFLTSSLHHQACFIHRELFNNEKYDINYRIMADWIHSVRSIIFNECSYKHIPYIIAKYDQNGISSNYQESQQERIKWLKNNLSKPFYESALELTEFQLSTFKEIIPILNKTRKFQKRAKRIVMFLYKINALFSKNKKQKE